MSGNCLLPVKHQFFSINSTHVMQVPWDLEQALCWQLAFHWFHTLIFKSKVWHVICVAAFNLSSDAAEMIILPCRVVFSWLLLKLDCPFQIFNSSFKLFGI